MGLVLDSRLEGHGKKFIAGTDKPTIADFVVTSHYFGLIYNDYGAVSGDLKLKVMKVISQTVNLQRYLETTMAQELADFLDKRPKYPF